jgi:hypothetical protein
MQNALKIVRACLVTMTLATVTLAGSVSAGELTATSHAFKTPIVELYTSEGCSSCPRADEWISKLGEALDNNFHAVPLAFHVDYWNRLGWVDPFSDPDFTKRQKELAILNRQRSMYTPEFLVSAKETRGTSAVVGAIQEANAELADVIITVGLMSDDQQTMDAELVINNQANSADLYLAVYESGIVREIKAGENRGRTLHYDFVVRHWQKVADVAKGEYQGKHSVDIGSDWNRQNLGFAAVVVDKKTGATLQAVRTNIAPVFAGNS